MFFCWLFSDWFCKGSVDKKKKIFMCLIAVVRVAMCEELMKKKILF